MGNKIFSHKKYELETSQINHEREITHTKDHSVQDIHSKAVQDLPENLSLMLPYNLVDSHSMAPSNYKGLSYERNKAENQKSFSFGHTKHIFSCFKRKQLDYWEDDSDSSDEWAEEDFLLCRERELLYQKSRISEDSTLPSISQEVALAADSSLTMPPNGYATINNPHALGTGDAKALSLSKSNVPNTIGNCKSKFKMSQHQIQNNEDKTSETKQNTRPIKKVHWKPEIDVIYFEKGSEVMRTTTNLKT